MSKVQGLQIAEVARIITTEIENFNTQTIIAENLEVP